jgi:cytochrome c-type biogenesis protein CcmF
MIGIIGHVLLLLAWIATGLSIFAFFQATQSNSPAWERVGRFSWFGMVAGVLGASAILYYLLVTHQFQYAYVYQNTSLELPKIFLVSAFWAGQEGSFLLWIGMMAVIGLALIRLAGDYERPVMTVVATSQFFLLSMIVGLDLGTISIGSSPFTTLAERFPDAPMLQVPGFVPADGTGLNDLLQNYWMAIHPPTLFVGFAAMVVPFAFAVAALWRKQYVEWVKAALPWTLFAVMALGVGIALGGYWAYVTLSFGGYWAWDPVENSSLVPWLIGVAAFHSMIIQKRSGSGHKAALILSIFAYMLVIYSTFLTRSGILGDVSVHSFVDLGLHNQLLIWIGGMALVGFGLFAYRYRELPTPEKEPNMLSREFMIFSGAMLLTALAAVILVGTSAPILGRIFRDNPSAVPLDFYNTWTLPLALGFVFLAGLGQLFWWNKMNLATVNRVLIRPLSLAVVSTILVLIFTPFIERTVDREALESIIADPMAQMSMFSGLADFWAVYGTGLQMLLLIFVAFFAFFGNGAVLFRVARGNLRMAGGALTHVGFALMVLGIMSSSGFSRPLAQATGVQIGDSRDNFVLTKSETRTVSGYQVTYRGRDFTDRGRPEYILDFIDPRGREYTLTPVVYKSNQDQWIQHPALRLFMDRDIYVAVTPSAMFESEEEQQQKGGMISLTPGDSTIIGDREYAVALKRLETQVSTDLLPENTDIAIGAVLEVTNLRTGLRRDLQPIYLIMEDRTQQYIQNRVRDWDMTVTFTGIELETGTVNLAFEGVDVMPEDWIVVQASEKPFINVMWFGFLVLTVGMSLSIARRANDVRINRKRLRTGESDRTVA